MGVWEHNMCLNLNSSVNKTIPTEKHTVNKLVRKWGKLLHENHFVNRYIAVTVLMIKNCIQVAISNNTN